VTGLRPLSMMAGLAALAVAGCIDGQILGGGAAISPVRPPAAVSAGSAACVPPAAPVLRTFTPPLFSRGADAAAEPDCTAPNPERGFFTFHDLGELRPDQLARGKHSLVYAQVVLADYLQRELDAGLLQQLRAGFATARQAGLKVLPRFYYAEGGGALASTDRVLAHIAQLAPVLRENADVIAALHAGFLGYWGEWHANGAPPAGERKRVLDALLAALPERRMVLVRRPSFKRDAFGGPLGEGQAFAGTPLSRVGHLNDCFLATDDDSGTYDSEADRRYAIADSSFTAVGGETCAVNPPRTDCPTALGELARHHWSFLNADYETAVIEQWQREGCLGAITCRLGYRFVVRGHATPAAVKRGATLALTLELTNDGYARAYNARPVKLVLSGPAKTVVLDTGADARAWAPGDLSVCLAAAVPADLPAGSYRLGLALPDPEPALTADARFAVQLGGGVTWDGGSGINQLDASVTVSE
jgi:hypothetical protein